MKVRKVNYKNEESLIIYITQDQYEDASIKKKILEYKSVYLNVIVFVSGNGSIENVLKMIIQRYYD